MARRPRIQITLTERIGAHPCHHGHKPGDTWDFDTERGKLCPMAAHVAFPYVDILRYGGSVPPATSQDAHASAALTSTRSTCSRRASSSGRKAASERQAPQAPRPNAP